MKSLSLTRNSSQLTQSTRRAMSARARSIWVQCSRKWDSKFVTTSCRITFDTYRPTCGRRRKITDLLYRRCRYRSVGRFTAGPGCFSGETHGDKLYGRGTSDMKSGVAAMTVMALRPAKISHRRAGMMLIFTAGEEITCVDAYAEIAKAWCGV